jgi:hypothetical protein
MVSFVLLVPFVVNLGQYRPLDHLAKYAATRLLSLHTSSISSSALAGTPKGFRPFA